MIDYESLLNHEIKAVKPSGIRKFFDIANEMEDVISLSIYSLACSSRSD